jgi:hypothetical protein
LLHAYGPTGVEPVGFPKFTGGWLSGTTPIGDVDGDGLLEIANWTREGNVFVWDTTVSVCDGDHEWPGFRHDNQNTGAYETDAVAPGGVTGLTAVSVPYTNTVTMNWTATGGDGICGRADHYEIRASRTPINETNWSTSQLVATKAALPSGTPEAHVIAQLPPNGRYLAVRAIDAAGNIGPIVLVIRPA